MSVPGDQEILKKNSGRPEAGTDPAEVSAVNDPDSECDRESAVLAVDDEPEVLSALARILLGEPYEFLRARSGSEALDLIGRFPVKVVITDERMPEMTGSELLARVREKRPGVGRIILTGYPGPTLFIQSLEVGGNVLLGKPWHEETLKRTIRNLIRDGGRTSS